MYEQFLREIKDKQLFTKDDRLLLAVSGGVDSMTLMHLLHSAGFTFAVAHCNFQLRGTDSDKDEQMVLDGARAMKIQCFTKLFDTNNYAREKGISIQMAARELRYTWFDELIVIHPFDRLVMAHHLDDSLETVLFNLTKGTGLAGLRGILPKNGNLVRPLLSFTKAQIVEYARQEGVIWREDVSNASDRYSRNLIRNRVIPLLCEINPGLLTTFRNTLMKLQATERLLKDVLEDQVKLLKRKVGTDWVITHEAVQNLVILEHLLEPFGFNFDQVKSIAEAAGDGNTGKRFLSMSWQLNIDRDSLIVSPVVPAPSEVMIQKEDRSVMNALLSLRFEIRGGNTRVTHEATRASIDLDKLNFPLKLRRWEAGDHFYPLGMGGKKKVSDFMIDNKIPLNLKERVCVLVSGDDIVWVVGHRLDNRYKVTAKTKRIYQIDVI